MTAAIQAVSAHFDQETNRTLARTENLTQKFDPEQAAVEQVAFCPSAGSFALTVFMSTAS